MTLRDVVYFAGAGFFGLFLSLVLVYFLTTTMLNGFLASSAISGSSAAVSVINSGQGIMNQMDKIAIAGFFAIVLAFIITSWFTSGHLIMTIVYIVGGVVGIVVAMFMSNFWESITNSAVLVGSLAYFPFANNIMLHLPLYIAIIYVLGLVIIFGKPVAFQTGGGGGDGMY